MINEINPPTSETHATAGCTGIRILNRGDGTFALRWGLGLNNASVSRQDAEIFIENLNASGNGLDGYKLVWDGKENILVPDVKRLGENFLSWECLFAHLGDTIWRSDNAHGMLVQVQMPPAIQYFLNNEHKGFYNEGTTSKSDTSIISTRGDG